VQSYAPRYGAGGAYGMSSYGGLGGLGAGGMGYSSYSSPYSRLGGYGGSYGGLGAYGGGYGGAYGSGGYGMGGYGVGGLGAPGEHPSLASSLQNSTAPAFAVLESLVTAFTSLAQLVESTYMATHSSFFAMVGVADQLGSLKTYLGQVLGVFSVLRLGRRILNWLRRRGGRRPGKQGQTGGWVNEWSGVAGASGAGQPVLGPDGQIVPRPSSKPLVLFLLSAVGLPWLMSRLIRLLIANAQRQQVQAAGHGNGTAALGPDGTTDSSELSFARAKWEFRAGEEWELSLRRDEFVAILEMRDGTNAAGGEEKGWWRGQTRDGRIGWFPGNYVEIVTSNST